MATASLSCVQLMVEGSPLAGFLHVQSSNAFDVPVLELEDIDNVFAYFSVDIHSLQWQSVHSYKFMRNSPIHIYITTTAYVLEASVSRIGIKLRCDPERE